MLPEADVVQVEHLARERGTTVRAEVRRAILGLLRGHLSEVTGEDSRERA